MWQLETGLCSTACAHLVCLPVCLIEQCVFQLAQFTESLLSCSHRVLVVRDLVDWITRQLTADSGCKACRCLPGPLRLSSESC
jgi:hypothetical protein